MTKILTAIKANKVISTSTVAGISLMLFASVFSVMPSSHASVPQCGQFFMEYTEEFDSNSVYDSDANDYINVVKCLKVSADCAENDAIAANNNEDVPKKSTLPTECSGFGVFMTSNSPDAILTDSVPAEWVAGGFYDVSGTCADEIKGNNDQGATVYTCTASDLGGGLYYAAFVVDELTTKPSPSNGKGNPENPKDDKYKPTSCELYKNEGAEGFVPDRTFSNGWLNGLQIIATETPFSTGLTDPVEVNVVGPGCEPQIPT
jgi:hypothetical protein